MSRSTPRGPDGADLGTTGSKPAPVEIERRFLVAALPTVIDTCRSTAIFQGYLAIGADGREVRLRRRGGRCLLTVKQGEGLVRGEVEIELGAAQFEALWPLTEGARLQKRRYEIPLEAKGAPGPSEGVGKSPAPAVELDVYAGRLEGLILAEVEFPDVEAAAAFAPPAWFGTEVTADRRYRNRELAVHGLPE